MTVAAQVYAFDAQNCYVLDIGIDPTMLPLIEPFTTMPTLAAATSGTTGSNTLPGQQVPLATAPAAPSTSTSTSITGH